MKTLFTAILSAVIGIGSWQFAAPPAPSKEASWMLRISEVRADFKAERCKPAAPADSTRSFRPGVGSIYSLLTVAEDGRVTYREALSCEGMIEDTSEGQWPSPGNPDHTYTAQLSPGELENLKSFLNSQDVKEIHDFLNQAPIFDNYKIEIKRGKDTQHVMVLAFMPEHVELKQESALTQLICRGKKIAAQANHSIELPDYCPCPDKR
jgi:hypothetical protein